MTTTDTISTLTTSTNVTFSSPGKTNTALFPLPPLQEGEYLVKTLYSGISAGTELTFFAGSNPKTSEGWDETNRLFRQDMEPDIGEVYPMIKGYMEVGEVIESLNQNIPVGAKVAMMYGHRAFFVANDTTPCVVLPDTLDAIQGIWVAHMLPICMNGVLYAADEVTRQPQRDLENSLSGQRVMVFGAGMVGLLTGMLAKWAGASEVAIIDTIPERLEVARKLGLTPFVAHADLAMEIKEHWQTNNALNNGADIAFQCTGSDFLLSEALRCLREQGTVIDLGFYQQGAGQVFLGKEFHHNRLRHICAQIGAIPRHQQELWSKTRLSEASIAFLEVHGDTLVQQLVTHIMSFSEAQKAFDGLAARDSSILQVVLQPDEE